MEKKNDEFRNGMMLYGKQRKRLNNNNKGGGGGGSGGGGGCNCFEFEKDNAAAKKRRLLVSVNVLGSAGPLRFLVNEEEVVVGVIESALKMYAKEGRLPALGSDSFKFLLYCANSGSDALSPWEEIGSAGKRNFVMCKKPDEQQPNITETRHHFISRKGGVRNWKTWLNKSFTFKIISSH